MGREKPVMEFPSNLTALLFFLGVATAIDANSEELYGEEYGSSEYEYGEYGDELNSEEYEKYIENLINESENETERAIGSFTTGPYYKKFVESSKELLRTRGLCQEKLSSGPNGADATGITALKVTSGTPTVRTET